ncbi:MAG: HK97-gp10 family putative phage morphogenesis protein [Pseudomonadota bacterium]
MAEFELVGMESLLAKFDSIKQDVKYKGGRSALRKAANFIAAKAKENAQKLDDPETAKNTAKNISVRWGGKRFKSTGDPNFRIGILGGAGGNKKAADLDSLPGKDTRTWRHLELGTEKTPAQPFLRPSLQNNTGEAISIFAKEYERAIDRAIKKAAKGK